MIWIAVAVVLFLALSFVLAKQRADEASGVHRYKRQATLFSPAERSFLGVLDLAVGKDFRIFGKVRVGDVLVPASGSGSGKRTAALNKINRKHFDFVLCRPDDLSVVCAIELNDKSHQRSNRRERDDFLADACRGAGLPLIWFDARDAYAAAEVAAKIAEAVTVQNAAGRVEPKPHAIEPPPDAVAASPTNSAPRCPRCSAEMVKRVAQGGSNAGKEFWGCSNFPRCREVASD